MPTRREFLGSAAALAVGLAGPAFGQEKEEKKPEGIIDINKSLQEIAKELLAEDIGATVDTYNVENPTGGVIQWRWNHFRPEMLDIAYPDVELINRELFEAMKKIRDLPNSGLDSLFIEGFADGAVRTKIREYRQIHRQLITNQLTTFIPFGGSDIRPTRDVVDRELWKPENMGKTTNQLVYPNYGGRRTVKVSPLARFGAGYILSELHDVTVLPTEDMALDARAEQAEMSGNPKEIEKWVMQERDKQFLKLMLESKRRLMHLLVGYNHNLTDDIAAVNAKNDERLSHIVISMKSLPDIIKRAEEHAKIVTK